MKQLIKHLDPSNRVILQDLDETHLFVDANAGTFWMSSPPRATFAPAARCPLSHVPFFLL